MKEHGLWLLLKADVSVKFRLRWLKDHGFRHPASQKGKRKKEKGKTTVSAFLSRIFALYSKPNAVGLFVHD